MRYFLELSYNGKPYHGWQNQPNAISVQEVIEKALTTILGEKISIMGAGRTDAGVHASQMFAHFDSQMAFEKEKFLYKLNSYLPLDIAIHDIFRVHDEAHTRFDALSRQYLYRITTKKNVFQFEQSYFVKKPLDVDKMNAASKILFDYEDFQCFSKSNTDVKTYNCEIMKAEWFYKDDELHFVIKANRFLRNMVRAIVGTMVNIGLGKIAVEEMHSIIQSKSRSEAGFSVPAHALFLTHIEYPEDIKK
ncbi:tRNA pseudouridine(38-40) synthase TruA [Tamlana sp. s12]|uniref:tRNA pseudouridine(38-40) synthase TruA n=1 Tax=Tamlana sp. s12 TaxID=1630406 RepID=UPI0007FEAF79|nr:tRNA pseudouridine(38-40) synthase TruA [Tamlana sp. s12]OBQ54592.1 pseudouridine synthase [Tamlana sp. s12]QQY82082.1 tRNA pseudouridine(38-40) synthase TruA [Tamlana sp. s12]